MSRKIEGTATWTWHEEAGGAWYVALDGRAVPPYLRQITVEAIVDVGSDGRVAGIKIIDALPPPPEGRVVSAAPDDLAGRVRDAVRDEYGSVLCAWVDQGTTRCCAVNVPPHKCRCDAIARAAIAAMPAIEALQRQLSEARAAQSELVDLVKQAVAPLSDEIEDLTRQLSASRAAEERMRAENARLVEELAETRENLEEEERSVSIYFAETQAAKAALVAMEKAKNEYATLAHERGKEVERLRAALQRLDPALGTS